MNNNKKSRFIGIGISLFTSLISIQSTASTSDTDSVSIPLSFEQNLGQATPEAAYISRGPEFTVFLSPQHMTFSPSQPLGTKNKKQDIRLHFLGSNLQPTIQGLQKKQGKSHYLTSNDTSRQIKNVPHFSNVKYDNLYPGIDLVVYGTESRKLEYDFIVNPDANPDKIRLQASAAGKLTLNNDGTLSIGSADNHITQHFPFIYQNIDGEKVRVNGSYKVLANNSFGFNVDNYNKALPLIIDPVIDYSTYQGIIGDESKDIVLDKEGYIYITGFTILPGLETGNAFQETHGGEKDAFVAKLLPDGSDFVYYTYLGGSKSESSAGSIDHTLAVDTTGNAYITGRTDSTDYPITERAFQSTLVGETDFYITKLNRDGSDLVFSTFLGGPDDGTPSEAGPTLALDKQNNVFIMGYTNWDDFPTHNPIQPSHVGGLDTIVTKLNSQGSEIIYSTYLGGSDDDKGRAIYIDKDGSALITGRTDSSDFPLANAIQPEPAGRGDVFITRISPDGTNYSLSTYFGGEDTDKGRAITTDNAGNIIFTGNTQSRNFPLESPIQRRLAGDGDAYVTSLTPDGMTVRFSTYWGGTSADYPTAIAIDRKGVIHISGSTESDNFPVKHSVQETLGGLEDGFFFGINKDGNRAIYSTYFGGIDDDEVRSLAVSPSRKLYAIGNTASNNLPLVSPLQSEPGGMFITIIDPFQKPVSPSP